MVRADSPALSSRVAVVLRKMWLVAGGWWLVQFCRSGCGTWDVRMPHPPHTERSDRGADLTQVELATQMGVAQSEISRIEKRHDMLLSTLTSYLSAAGEHPRVVVTVNGKDVELDLTTLAGAL